MGALPNPKHERFCLAFVTLELISPDDRKNIAEAYKKAYPQSNPRRAGEHGSLLKRQPHIIERIEDLQNECAEAGHITRTGPWIDELVFEAMELARAKGDAATMLRGAELADRGRHGGPLYVKETRTRKIGNVFDGKSLAEVMAIRQRAIAVLQRMVADPDQEKFIDPTVIEVKKLN